MIKLVVASRHGDVSVWGPTIIVVRTHWSLSSVRLVLDNNFRWGLDLLDVFVPEAVYSSPEFDDVWSVIEAYKRF